MLRLRDHSVLFQHLDRRLPKSYQLCTTCLTYFDPQVLDTLYNNNYDFGAIIIWGNLEENNKKYFRKSNNKKFC